MLRHDCLLIECDYCGEVYCWKCQPFCPQCKVVIPQPQPQMKKTRAKPYEEYAVLRRR